MMQARWIAMVMVGAATGAHADPTVLTAPAPAADELGDQGIGASLGLAAGGRVTAGGLRVAGHYLYQLSAQDWFDGTASFTYGGRDASCALDSMDTLTCNHGLADGSSVEISATVRRMFGARGSFRPFARAGLGVALVRFGADDVSGIAFPVHLGGGVRAQVAPSMAIVSQAELTVGAGGFGRGLGLEPTFGMAVTAGAEFRLR